MSYILDALKKSDHERSRERGPTLASVHGGWQPPSPWIRRVGPGLALLMVLLLLAAWGAWLMIPPGIGHDSNRVSNPVDIDIPDPVVEKGAIERPMDPSGGLASEQTAMPEAAQPAASPRAIQELWELPDPVRAAFPALTFSFHVYADTPSRRAIIINNRRYSEQDAINSELRLEEITEQGVILQFQRYRVHIPIVNDW